MLGSQYTTLRREEKMKTDIGRYKWNISLINTEYFFSAIDIYTTHQKCLIAIWLVKCVEYSVRMTNKLMLNRFHTRLLYYQVRTRVLHLSLVSARHLAFATHLSKLVVEKENELHMESTQTEARAFAFSTFRPPRFSERYYL